MSNDEKTCPLSKIFRDSDGNIVIGQAPNAPLLVWCCASLIRFTAPQGALKDAARMVSFGSILYWSWLELVSGVNYFRRACGLVTMLFAVSSRIKNKQI
ncbi:MAG TPA: hypothetical protein V6C76_01880 [Drouetiella sp.]